jgi:hypothetical protein
VAWRRLDGGRRGCGTAGRRRWSGGRAGTLVSEAPRGGRSGEVLSSGSFGSWHSVLPAFTIEAQLHLEGRRACGLGIPLGGDREGSLSGRLLSSGSYRGVLRWSLRDARQGAPCVFVVW